MSFLNLIVAAAMALGALATSTSTVTVVVPDAPLAQRAAPPSLQVDQLREVFAERGFRVDPAIAWEWLSPPVTTFQVHEPRADRVLLVQVYPDEPLAQSAQHQAPAALCYATSAWVRNVAIFESTEASLRACLTDSAPTGMTPDMAASPAR
jgi:hypothetical protein